MAHNFVLKQNADIVFVTETKLDENIPANYGRIPGYSEWHRRDRTRDGGGVALCYKTGTRLQIVDEVLPVGLEIVIFIIYDKSGVSTLCLGCYRPPTQIFPFFQYITDNLDSLINKYRTNRLLIIGDLNPPTALAQYRELVTIFDLRNHVDFPTHDSGSMLDPILTDGPQRGITCEPLGNVGSSDHSAVLARIAFSKPANKPFTRRLWKWKEGNFEGMRQYFNSTDWENLLVGDVNQQVEALTEILWQGQCRYVPSKTYTSRTGDLAWFGDRCRQAAEAKYRAWKRLKQHRSARNRQLHRQASQRMEEVQRQAIHTWKMDIRSKLISGNCSSRDWWRLIQQHQGTTKNSELPPINISDKTIAFSNDQKAEAFATYFATKMKVPEPQRTPPCIPRVTLASLNKFVVKKEHILENLKGLDTSKATGPDKISPMTLKNCAAELTKPISIILNNCFQANQWPRLWKLSSIVPVHKKGSQTVITNYRPVSLLSIMSKLCEKIIYDQLLKHLLEHKIISDRQFGSRKGRSAADLHLLLASRWSAALDQGLKTMVLAVDIDGAFDRVWHAGLLAKLESMGVEGGALKLLGDYLVNEGFK